MNRTTMWAQAGCIIRQRYCQRSNLMDPLKLHTNQTRVNSAWSRLGQTDVGNRPLMFVSLS